MHTVLAVLLHPQLNCQDTILIIWRLKTCSTQWHIYLDLDDEIDFIPAIYSWPILPKKPSKHYLQRQYTTTTDMFSQFVYILLNESKL